MRSFRPLQQTGRLVNGGPPLIDPATLNLSGWWEQGMGADYDPGAGTPWPGLASAGASGGRGLVAFGSAPWVLPTIGSAIDSTNSVRFGTDLRDLKASLTNTSFFTASEFTIGGLIKLDPTVGVSNPTAGGQAIMFGLYANVFAGQTGGVGRLNLHTVSTIDNWRLSPTFALNTWVSFFARLSVGNLSVRVNKSTGGSTAAANVNAAWSGSTPRVAHSTNGCSIHDRLAAIYSPVALSDDVCDKLHDRWKARFPTAGLP